MPHRDVIVVGASAGGVDVLKTLTSGLPRDIPDTSALFAHPDFETLPYQLLEREKDYDEARYLHS